MWIIIALIGAVATAATAVLMKVGLEKVDSNLGFAVQSVIILVLSWIVVGVQGKGYKLSSIEPKAWLFLALSGVSTTIAYLFYFRALSMGDPAKVAPVDRLSLVFTIMLTAVFLREKISSLVIVGATLMAIGAVLVAMAPAQQ
ncbi:MAG: EamA family transporter [Abitibacteriaceae bacterium]|nr:EamA family transporter [Abditibacteriaceae bacterium]